MGSTRGNLERNARANRGAWTGENIFSKRLNDTRGLSEAGRWPLGARGIVEKRQGKKHIVNKGLSSLIAHGVAIGRLVLRTEPAEELIVENPRSGKRQREGKGGGGENSGTSASKKASGDPEGEENGK